MLYLLSFSSTSTALRPATTIDPCVLYSDPPASVRSFIDKVWDESRWRRGDPPAKTVNAWRLHLHCLPPSWQKKLKQRWRELQGEFFDRRGAELRRRRVTPEWGCTSLGGCKFWALPAYIVDCESGGDYTPDAGLTFGGAYGILVSTWQQFGGLRWASQANYAPPYAQDIVARRVWLAVGSSAWACA